MPVYSWLCTACYGAGGGGNAAGSRKGGLVTFFYMVLAGLAATTPHMQSATVQALARLVYEFGGELEAFLPELLPVVTSLARVKSREVVKSVLGFLKVWRLRRRESYGFVAVVFVFD
jgi:hypothetical protein